MERTILHCDMNHFYAAVECLYEPKLQGKPVAVLGNPELRHGIVLAKSDAAKRCGVKTGDTMWMARQKCPEILFVPPHFERYLEYSKLAQEIYYTYTDRVEPFGLDECWLDVTDGHPDTGRRIADTLRRRIFEELGVTVSVGVSFNKIFAKLGSDLKKPDATTCIPADSFRDIIWPLAAKELLFVGPATNRKLARNGIFTIGELACAQPVFLRNLLGKPGETLWQFANGLDRAPVARYGESQPIKSIGNSTTTPRDLLTETDRKVTLYALCESVAGRLRAQGFCCRTVQIGVRDNQLNTFERQTRLEFPARSAKALFEAAFELLESSLPSRPIRTLHLRACDLFLQSGGQLSCLSSLFFEAAQIEKWERIEETVDTLCNRFGAGTVRRGILLCDPALSDLSGPGTLPHAYCDVR